LELFDVDVNIGKHVFNRSVDPRTGQLLGAQTIALYLTAFTYGPLRKRQFEVLEDNVARF
jgi:hypothetical protein